MKDKELLIEAIYAHDVYASSRRLTLKTLVELAVDGTVSVSPAALAKFIKIGRGVVYHNLRILEEDGYIKNVGKRRQRIGIYELNETKLAETIEIYKKKQKYLT